MPLGRDTLVPDGNSNGRLQYIRYGDANDSAAQLVVGNYYDSFGNIIVSDRDFSRSAFDHGAFTYDAQQRLTNGYGVNYAYDAAGRLTTYEGLATTVNNAFPAHALKNPGYSYDANGNLVTRPGQTLTWNAENQLASVTGNGVSESYTYDANGQRVRKVSNGVTTYYPNQYYEQTGAIITKYHYFNGQRVSLHTNAPGYWIHYDLHSDHLGSTVLTTNQGGSPLTRQNYFAYGKYRPGDNGLQTDHRFTGQPGDATGLLYYGARYYDPQLGQFISPDTLVPDATNLFDYNRYMYARGNPMRYNDPTGHCVEPVSGVICVLAVVGAAFLLQGDDTTYQPTQADINSQRVGGSMLTAAAGLLGLNALFGSSAAAAVGESAATTCAETDCVDKANEVALINNTGRMLSEGENSVAQMLVKEGNRVEVVAEGTTRQPDFLVNGVATELKTLSNITSKDISGAVARRILEGAGQASHIIVDVRSQTGFTPELAQRAINRAFGADTVARLQQIRIVGNGFDVIVPRVSN